MTTPTLEDLAERYRAALENLPVVDLQKCESPGLVLYQQNGSWMDAIEWAITAQASETPMFVRITVVLLPSGKFGALPPCEAHVYRKGNPVPLSDLNEYAGMMLWSMLRSGACRLVDGEWHKMLNNLDNAHHCVGPEKLRKG